MIYTIGIKKNYDKYIEEYGDRCEKEIGGTVWQYPELALLHIEKCYLTNYDVYGVEADWEYDTKKCYRWNKFRELKRRARIVKI